MNGIGLILLILAVIAIFGGIYFALWCLCALQRNQKEDIHAFEEAVDLEEGHHIIEEDGLNDKEFKCELNLKLLPAEIQEKVFCLLPPRDIKNAVQVCRWWREVGEVPRLWTWACFEVRWDVNSAQKLNDMLTSRRIHSVKRMKVLGPWIRERSYDL